MARIKPPVVRSETKLLDEAANLTSAKRADVAKHALAAYLWIIRQTIDGAKIVARKRSGDEATLECPELADLGGQGNRLSPKELGQLAKKLTKVSNPVTAAEVWERINLGFYGS
ncbi:MAG: hypothetical protein O6850_07555 [Acidobacteria bacterium]|nr:hypothetical protein [Acidobacteriota bacterium]